MVLTDSELFFCSRTAINKHYTPREFCLILFPRAEKRNEKNCGRKKKRRRKLTEIRDEYSVESRGNRREGFSLTSPLKESRCRTGVAALQLLPRTCTCTQTTARLKRGSRFESRNQNESLFSHFHLHPGKCPRTVCAGPRPGNCTGRLPGYQTDTGTCGGSERLSFSQ